MRAQSFYFVVTNMTKIRCYISMPAFKYSKPYTRKAKSALGQSSYEQVTRTRRTNLSKELAMIERLDPDAFHIKTFKVLLALDRNRHQCSIYINIENLLPGLIIIILNKTFSGEYCISFINIYSFSQPFRFVIFTSYK